MALEKPYSIYGATVSGYFRVAQMNVVYNHGYNDPTADEFYCEFRLDAVNGPEGNPIHGGNNLQNGDTWYRFMPEDTLISGVRSLPEACYNHLKTMDIFSEATDH